MAAIIMSIIFHYLPKTSICIISIFGAIASNISQLLAAGYKETIAGTTDPVYAKVVGHTSYLISIAESDIYFSTSEYSQLLTYDELLVEAEEDGFDSARFDRFVKIDGMENNYYFDMH